MSATKQKKRIFPAYFVSKPNKTKQSQWLLEGFSTHSSPRPYTTTTEHYPKKPTTLTQQQTHTNALINTSGKTK
jgi:hypothetical protein